MTPEQKVRQILKNNPEPVGEAHQFKAPPIPGVYDGDRLPNYVKCKVCGKPPLGADWLKPVSPEPDCREFIHLSHIPSGPILQHAVERVRSI